MRRPVYWFVFCLSLAFLFANVTFGRRTDPALDLAAIPLAAPGFSKVFAGEPAAVQFGYVRDDGSFEPLPEQPATRTDADEEFTSALPSWQ